MTEVQRTEEAVNDLKVSLQEMPEDMRLFSLSMRSLYSDKAVGSSNETAQKFRMLRDNTRNDAVVFLKCILPVSTKFVASISEYFEYYTALSYDEWCEMLSDIHLETVTYKQLAATVLEMYEEILVPLKKRQDEASIIMAEFQNLQSEFEKQKKEYEDRANKKRSWAIGLSFLPGVNFIACPILAASAKSDVAEAIAKNAESKIHEAAALTVKETLIPALANFINGLRKIAGFFSIMEQELTKFEGKTEKGKASQKMLYFKVMNKQAEDMKCSCQSFYAVLPDVRTDFESIPAEGTNLNYVDTWLRNKKAAIAGKVTGGKLVSALFKAISDGRKEAK